MGLAWKIACCFTTFFCVSALYV